MLFKSMEIYGFKSFPDKTILNFDKKMTAVVGSNGNGKSNISDALRWVMGEQGVKSLRGDKMEDVIFHGTVRRKPMGFAKVALTIDNSDRALKIDADEVVISRKLYRSGESEYKINGAKALLKNIHELFMGTGLGRDGYSVIGQGKVSEIVESAGTKRREVFEEAAGVSKFLAQKKDAENKLKRAEENLLRLRDIAKELEERLPVLEKQAAKAKKAKVLVEREQELDISVSVYELAQLEKVLQETDDKILLNKGQLENIERDIEKLLAEEEESGTRRLELRAKLEELQSKGDKARERIAEINQQIAVSKNDIHHATEQIEDYEKQIEDGKLGAEKLEKEKADLFKQIDEKSSEIDKLKNESAYLSEKLIGLASENEALDEEYRQIDAALGKLYLKRTQLQLQLQQLGLSGQEADARKQELLQSIESSKTAINEQKAKLRETEKELEAANDEKAETENKLVGYKKLYEGKSTRLKAAGQTLESLKKEYDTKRSRYDVLDGIDKNMAGFTASVKSVVTAAKQGRLSGIKGTVADIISVDKRYTVAIEIALGGIMQNIVTDNEDTAKRSMRYLKENNLGRATFLPITSVRGKQLEIDGLADEEGYEGMASTLVDYDSRYDGIVKSILGKTAVVEDIDTASFIAKKYGYRFKIVTLDGQVINAGGSFTGGSVKADAGIISRKQELQLLTTEIETLSAKIKTESEQLKPLQAETAKMSLEMEGFAEILAACEPKIARCEAERDGIKRLVSQMLTQQEMNEELLDKQDISAADAQKKEKELSAELDTVSMEIEKNEKLLADKKSSLEQADSGKKEIADRISSNNIAMLAAEKDIEAIKIRIDATDNSIKSIASGGSEQQSRIAQLKAEIEEIEKQIAERQKSCEEISSDAKGGEQEINDNLSLSNAIEQKITEINKSIRELTESKEKFSAELARQEERSHSANVQTEKIINNFWDKYELTRSEAKAKAVIPDDVQAAKVELQEIKRSIAALGNVNYSSIEELEELKERYGVMATQLADVEKSKSELEKLINDLIKDIKQRFTESFNSINHHFGNLFSEIFGGGEARLELSNPDDVLSSDVEIYAAPPGKVIKSLSLLSGGEKSMVALTIYLAILLHRPTPFCMLDEVDAALDEVNVQKYATYLKRFSRNTQLMVITHRRGTIELCDILYGVYMQEKGVSRLLKQEFTPDLELELE